MNARVHPSDEAERRAADRCPSAAPRRRSVGRPAQAGYTMVALVMAVTVLVIGLAIALPMWSTWIQREKEEELIFRGLQYAEAIRVFQRRFGRPPVRLEELLEVKPRSIRQLWRDPITDSKDWGLVLANAGRPVPPRGRPQPGPRQPDPRNPQDDSPPLPDPRNPQDDGGGFGGPEPGPEPGTDPGDPTRPQQRGPIQGVYSKSRKEAIKVFLDRQRHNEWQFTVNLLMAPAGAGAQGLPNLSSRWIGRPLQFAPAQGQPTPGGPQPTRPTPPAGGKP